MVEHRLTYSSVTVWKADEADNLVGWMNGFKCSSTYVNTTVYFIARRCLGLIKEEEEGD